MNSDLMIDLETLATSPQTAVVSLGAQFFDIETKTLGSTFEMVLELQPQIDSGREISASTLKWWMGQEEAAKRVFHEKAQPPTVVLGTFVNWYKSVNPKAFVWGNGSTFDISIMENIFRMYKIEVPWGYNKAMDLRTFKRFNAPAGAKIPVAGVKHNCLADATAQARFVLENLK